MAYEARYLIGVDPAMCICGNRYVRTYVDVWNGDEEVQIGVLIRIPVCPTCYETVKVRFPLMAELADIQNRTLRAESDPLDEIKVTQYQLDTLVYLDNYIDVYNRDVDMVRMAHALGIARSTLNTRLKELSDLGLAFYDRNRRPTRGVTELGKRFLAREDEKQDMKRDTEGD